MKDISKIFIGLLVLVVFNTAFACEDDALKTAKDSYQLENPVVMGSYYDGDYFYTVISDDGTLVVSVKNDVEAQCALTGFIIGDKLFEYGYSTDKNYKLSEDEVKELNFFINK